MRSLAMSMLIGASSIGGLSMPAMAPANEPDPTTQSQPTRAHERQVVVVQMHAEWCEGCRRLGDLGSQLGGDFVREPVGFVRFDLSTSSDEATALVRARAMGLDGLLRANYGRTGIVYVVDGSTRKVLSTLTAKDGAAGVRAAIRKALLATA